MNAAPVTRDALIGDWTVRTTPDGECLGQLSLLPDFTYINSPCGAIPGRHWGNWSLTDCGEFQFIRFDLEGAEPKQRAEPDRPEPVPWPDFVLAMILAGDEQRIDMPGAIWTRTHASSEVSAELTDGAGDPVPIGSFHAAAFEADPGSRPHAVSHKNL